MSTAAAVATSAESTFRRPAGAGRKAQCHVPGRRSVGRSTGQRFPFLGIFFEFQRLGPASIQSEDLRLQHVGIESLLAEPHGRPRDRRPPAPKGCVRWPSPGAAEMWPAAAGPVAARLRTSRESGIFPFPPRGGGSVSASAGQRRRTAARSMASRASIVAARHSGSESNPTNSGTASNSSQSVRLVQPEAQSSARSAAAVNWCNIPFSVANKRHAGNPNLRWRRLLP